MEEEVEKQTQQQPHLHQRPTATQTIPSATTKTALGAKKDLSGGEVVVVAPNPAGDMGRTRRDSSSNSVGWLGEGGGVGTVKSPTVPRQSSKRDSGYHTDCSPATFAATHAHFTFDSTEERPCLLPLVADSNSPPTPLVQYLPLAVSSLTSPLSTSALARPSSSPSPPAVTPTVTPRTRPARWSPTDVIGQRPDHGADDDEALAAGSDKDVIATSQRRTEGNLALTRRGDDDNRLALSGVRGWGEDTEGGKEWMKDRDGCGIDMPAVQVVSRREREEEEDHDDCCEEEVNDDDDGDDDDGDDGQEEQEGGMAVTDYHHGPLSLLRLPDGGRIRPLLARTIATQTPHLHCQLMEQIMSSQHQPLLHCVRGSAVRRLRYYSEGEESMPAAGISSTDLTHGPLPDIVPGPHHTTGAHRERSLSAPDIEVLQRQRELETALAVGRELRRISDEFLRSHEALRGNPNGALAALQAELNGAAAFFLTGVRRFLYSGLTAYFRFLFHWTRRTATERRQRDSSVDRER